VAIAFGGGEGNSNHAVGPGQQRLPGLQKGKRVYAMQGGEGRKRHLFDSRGDQSEAESLGGKEGPNGPAPGREKGGGSLPQNAGGIAERDLYLSREAAMRSAEGRKVLHRKRGKRTFSRKKGGKKRGKLGVERGREEQKFEGER